MQLQQTEVYVSGDDGYNTYRIPSIIAISEGGLLAFCEGRRDSWRDKSPTDLLVKRSDDGGRSWSDQITVVAACPDAAMDACPVVDSADGTIWLVYDRYPEGFKWETGHGMDSGTCWVTKGTKDGTSWSVPRNITADTKDKAWSAIAHGPGVGIQTGSGRIVIPCNFMIGSERKPSAAGCFITYSDDHGRSWKLGGSVGPEMNESQVVELSNGNLMLNMRSLRGRGCRAQSISTDEGMTWSPPEDVPVLVEPACQGSIVKYPAEHGLGDRILLFANPADKDDRINLTIRASYDDGATWSVARTVNEGGSSYCCLVVLADGSIGVLYERIDNRRQDRQRTHRDRGWLNLVFARFDLDWIGPGG
jgi:sialidase-1